jgi:hypothetical protein
MKDVISILGNCSEHSSIGIAVGYRLDDRSSIPAGAKDFPLLHIVTTGSEVHPDSCEKGAGALSPGVKRPRRETNHSPPSVSEVNNCGSMPPLLHTSSWHSVYLLKQRDNFTFYITLLGNNNNAQDFGR